LEALNSDTDVVEFLALEESVRLAFREGALFEAHDDHDDHDKDHDNHDDHDDHDDHDKDHDEHDDHAGHDHGEFDPHAWLSTSNAKTWLNVIAAKLSSVDPSNAGTYFANASQARNELDALDAEINAMLGPVRGGKFIVFHDAYQYFEAVYDIPASGAISLGDASDPSAARIAEIANRIKTENIDCVLSEPQFNARLVKTVMGATDAKTQVIDPIGFGIESGSSLYPKLIRSMAQSLVDCLK
jgi:zinc transport system substrate-binding protein